jgi:hypothetical protein
MNTEQLPDSCDQTPIAYTFDQKDRALSEIKTLVRILNTWGNAIVPSLDGRETTALERLNHFTQLAMTEHGMTMDDIEDAIA